jgi:ribosome modulation factor
MPTIEQLAAHHWGEKAAMESHPECPYVRPDLARAWREGLRFARERFGGSGPLVTSEKS